MLINSFVFASASTLWTPAAITTALWLDAADASTVTTVSGAVSQWNDKSGNGRNATQATSTHRPLLTSNGLNSKNVITFDGSNDWLSLASSLLSNQTAFSWYLVGARANTNTQCFFMERVASDAASIALLPVSTISILNRAGGPSAPGVIEQTESVSFPVNSAQLCASVQAATSGTAYRNGNAAATNSTTKASLTFRAMAIGGGQTLDASPAAVQQFLAGYIAEMVFALSTLSSDNHQRTEGYLAHKWGLTANLPAGHPYKSTAPTI